MKAALDVNTVRKLEVKEKKMKFSNTCKFQIWGYLSGSRLAVFWEIHANTSKETVVAIYRG